MGPPRMRTFEVPCPFSPLFVTSGAASLQCYWSDSEATSQCLSFTDNARFNQNFRYNCTGWQSGHSYFELQVPLLTPKVPPS